MKSRISGIIPLLLITLVCIGLVEGGYQMVERFILDASVSTESSAVIAVPERPAATAENAKKSDYRVILKRNLFGPPADVTAATPADRGLVPDLQATSLNIVLMGTITGSEGTEMAFILDKNSQQQDLYKKGTAIQGAMVKEIGRGKVILSYAGKDEILDMSEAAKVRPPVRPAPVAAGQSSTPARVVPRPAATAIAPPPPGEMTGPTQTVNVNRARRTFTPQRVYRPTQAPKKE